MRLVLNVVVMSIVSGVVIVVVIVSVVSSYRLFVCGCRCGY